MPREEVEEKAMEKTGNEVAEPAEVHWALELTNSEIFPIDQPGRQATAFRWKFEKRSEAV